MGGHERTHRGIIAPRLQLRQTLHSRLAREDAADGVIGRSIAQGFEEARTWAYTAFTGAVGFGAITGALAAWYVFGSLAIKMGARV